MGVNRREQDLIEKAYFFAVNCGFGFMAIRVDIP
jgi:hypothetical protein